MTKQEKQKIYSATKYQKYKDKIKARTLAYKRANPEKHALHKFKSVLKLKFKITFEQYLLIFSQQNGKCSICSVTLVLRNKNTHLDHNHTTGKIRGILCKFCNNGLGFFYDSPEKLRNAAIYLENSK